MEQKAIGMEPVPLKVEIVQGSGSDTPVSDSSEASLLSKALRTVVAIAIVFSSFFIAAPVFSDPEFHSETIAVLDEKKANVVALAAVAAGASLAVELVPGEAGNSVATELADLSSDFTVIVVAILLEKYLLTVLALVSFKLLIPAACILYVVGVWRERFGTRFFSAAVKVSLLSLVLVLMIPASTQVARIIDETFETSLIMAESVGVDYGKGESSNQVEDAAEEGFSVDFILGLPEKAAEAVSEVAMGAVDWAATSLGNLLEAFAIMVVTSCVIPVLMVVLALWFVNLIFGIDIKVPIAALKGRAWRAPMRASREKATNGVNVVLKRSGK